MSAASDERHEVFCQEYARHRNATRAYKAAGYEGTPGAMRSGAARLLTGANIQARIEELKAERRARLDLSREDLENELASVATVTLRDFFDGDGGLIPPAEWTDEMASAVQEITVHELFSGKGEEREVIGLVKRVKLWPKLEAISMLGASHGIGVKKVELGKPGEFDPAQAGMSREEKEKLANEKAQKLGFNVVPMKRAAG